MLVHSINQEMCLPQKCSVLPFLKLSHLYQSGASLGQAAKLEARTIEVRTILRWTEDGEGGDIYKKIFLYFSKYS